MMIDNTGRCEACGCGHYEACEGLPCRTAIARADYAPELIPARDAAAALVHGFGYHPEAVTYALAPFTDAAGQIDPRGLSTAYRALKAAVEVPA